MSCEIDIHDNMELTDEQKERYWKSNGICCPFCGALEGENEKGKYQSFEYSDIELEGEHYQKITCFNKECGKSWYEVFVLTGIEDAN